MRRSACLLSLLVTLSPVAPAHDNVLILIADDLGVDYVAAYDEGPAYGPTPHIDGLAAQGVLFRNAWANAQCSPTRAAFHTGRHGYRTGVGAPGGGSALDLDEVTLPEALDGAGSGYAHALFGKWHLGQSDPSQPNLSGWSHYAGMLSNPGDYFAWTRTENGVQSQSTTYSTTHLVDDAIAWIAQQDQPWVCTVAFNAPHAPFHEPPAHLHSQTLPPNATNQQRYVAMVEAMDTEIGRLTEALEALAPDTNVVFFGDNGSPGQASVAPFVSSHAKGSPYEGGVNVPLLVAGPIVTSPGREVSALISVVDVFASLSDLVGVDLSPPIISQDSVSFVPYLTDPAQPPLRERVYSERFQGNKADTDGFSVARDSRYKLIRRYDQGGVAAEEMYDLATDPFELNDLLPSLSAVVQLAYDGLDAHMLAVRDKTGGYETLGTPTCVGSNGAPQIAGVGEPTVGAAHTVVLTQAPPATMSLLAIGLSDSYDTALGAALPLDLSLLGAGPGCLLRSSTEWLFPVPTTPTGGAIAPVPVPDQPILIKGTIHHTWIVLDPTAPGTMGLTVSPALRVTLGG